MYFLIDFSCTLTHALHTELYTAGQRNESLNLQRFGIWIAIAVWDSIVCFFGAVHTPFGQSEVRIHLSLSHLFLDYVIAYANTQIILNSLSYTHTHSYLLSFPRPSPVAAKLATTAPPPHLPSQLWCSWSTSTSSSTHTTGHSRRWWLTGSPYRGGLWYR